jgi:hypothetical protein
MALLRQEEGQWGVSPKADTGPLLATYQEPPSLDRIKHATFFLIEKLKLETELKSFKLLRLLASYIKLLHAHAIKA